MSHWVTASRELTGKLEEAAADHGLVASYPLFWGSDPCAITLRDDLAIQ